MVQYVCHLLTDASVNSVRCAGRDTRDAIWDNFILIWRDITQNFNSNHSKRATWNEGCQSINLKLLDYSLTLQLMLPENVCLTTIFE